MLLQQTGSIMEKQTIFNLMNSSESFSKDTLTQLKELMVKYPFFQGARVLYLQNLKFIESSTLNLEVQSQAILIADRQHLFVKLNAQKTAEGNVNNAGESQDVKVEVKARTKKIKKTQNSESSFTLLEGSNHADAKTINADATPNSSDTDILELIEGDTSTGADTNGKSSGQAINLIDAFLTSNPKIERPAMPVRGETVENEDISLNSVTEPEEVASEPLAQIFLAQGYFDKAIGVYQKLSLKYPEKSSYFADQILKIKEQIK